MKYLLPFIFLLGCSTAKFSDKVSYDPKVIIDDFDNTKRIVQEPVSSGHGMSDGNNLLGFVWLEQYPESVLLNAEITGLKIINDLRVIIDNEEIKVEKGQILSNRKISNNPYISNSTSKMFVVSLEDFSKMENAGEVKVRVITNEGNYDSKFGKQYEHSFLQFKVVKFLNLIKGNNK